MHRLNWLAFVVGVGALLLLGASGTGTRLEFWTYRTGLTLIRYAAYAGIGAMVLGAIALLVGRFRASGTPRPSLAVPALALVLGAVSFLVPYSQMRTARSVPPIHDITTDTADPPQFVEVLPLRADAPNSAEYEGEVIAEQQRAAYPEVQPLVLQRPPDVVFAAVLDLVAENGWEFVSADPATGRIEATATTRWFGFKDDVVVRLRPNDAGTTVDVRSVSRVGRSDVGANAARISGFLEALAARD